MNTAVRHLTSTVRPVQQTRSPQWLAAGLAVAVGFLILVALVSLAIGSRAVPIDTVTRALLHFDPHVTDQRVIHDMRVPRALLGVVVGAALGVAGTLLQGVTRNPLADPGIMGINAGAALAVVVGITTFGIHSLTGYVWLAFLGAALATLTVYTLASFGREGATPVKLALAGAALTATFSSISTAIQLVSPDALNQLRFWLVGSLGGRYFPIFWQVLPFIVVGLIAAIGLARPLNGLALGEDTARALGQHVERIRAATFVVVILLSGAATAACGPIVFVGLVVPLVARALCGPDYRWIIPYSAVLTPLFFLVADLIGRVALPGEAELDVGVVLGVVGAPLFVLIVRYRDMNEL